MSTLFPPPQQRRKPGEALPLELFALLQRNEIPLFFLGAVGTALGGLSMIGAICLWLVWNGPLTFFVGANFFFVAALILTPSIHLLRYRQVLMRARRWPSSDGYELVLVQQRRFWRFIGVTTIICLAVVLLVELASLA